MIPNWERVINVLEGRGATQRGRENCLRRPSGGTGTAKAKSHGIIMVGKEL